MRLSKIKLVGFKSFVDPTTLSFPSNLVGVVGPNGCGKSNVIDAVRWVMGESSAKHLRGSAMLDVIFNGSTTRKPAELAAVELYFSGVNVTQYPPDSEIAIKRQLTYDGQSTYFINNIRCRRKDITDLFLGTGLGPRSYAIIEQGMISRLIEAKPEELRIFLEEAAGISKYKERRKETEQRMQQTRENLARLDEVRHELDKQVEKLQKQAKQAEKFQELKKSEHLLKAQLHAIRWHELDLTVQELQQQIDEHAIILERDLHALQNLEGTHKQQRQAQIQAQAALDDKQAQFYTIEGEINRLEQTIEHIREKNEQLQFDGEQLANTLQEVKYQLALDEEQLEQSEDEIRMTRTEREALVAETAQANVLLHQAEHQLKTWHLTWDIFNQKAAEPVQLAQIAKMQLQNLEARLMQNQQRLFRLREEGHGLDARADEQAVQLAEGELKEVQIELTEIEAILAIHQEAVLRLRDEVQTKSAYLHEYQSKTHQLSGRLASLEALQEAALGKNSADLNAWLHAHHLQDVPRLAQLLTVAKNWQPAVEMVLNTMLQAWCVEDLTVFQMGLQRPPQGELVLFETVSSQTMAKQQDDYVTLQQKINAPCQLESLLAGIYVADTLEQAYQLREHLAIHESVITPQGVWLGKHWLRSQQGTHEKSGVIEREQEINHVAKQLAGFDEEIIKLSNELEKQRLALHTHENGREQTQQQVDSLRQQQAQLQAQYGNKIIRLEHLKAQIQRVQSESADLTQQISEDNQALEETRHQLHATLAEMDKLADEREELTKKRGLYQEMVEQAREVAHTAKEAFHQVDVRLESLRTDIGRLQQSILRLNSRLEQLAEKRYELQQKLEKQTYPLENFQSELMDYTQQRAKIEESLLQVKQTLVHLEAALSEYEEERHRLEKQCNQLRTELEQARMVVREKEVRKQTLEEQLNELKLGPVALLAELPEYADEASWIAQLDAVERKIERIGSVNLAALQEFSEQSERKRYLDEQADDLNKSLNLLENAIKMIDRETRHRFKETLETVNSNLQEMFPHLFGGGHASLELTHDDVLVAGVAIMARPPGKRNSTIHLLSGGEKALTAIALVFSIFQLNPAPFCMLDEVDAPLDDSNVGRFSHLVKMMSDRVQFIFISHNKLTMEIAEQLIGVTMQEAGVSRFVSVDIDTAVSMVAL